MGKRHVVSDLIILEVDSHLLVDDHMCSGDPSTSIYNLPVEPC
jgi:hypothetical protein